jgi:hypothetical protein
VDVFRVPRETGIKWNVAQVNGGVCSSLEAEMREEVDADEGICDAGHHELPREIPAWSQVESEGQPSIGGDGSAVRPSEVVVYVFLASWNEPTAVRAEV